jgi:hypothetical protein
MPVNLPGHPPSAIFTAPRGLQSFLGTQAVGQNPDKLAELVQAEINLAPWLHAGRGYVQKNVSGTLALALAPSAISNNNLVVPAGKVWIPHSVMAIVTPGAGAGTVRPNIVLGTDAGGYFFCSSFDFNAATTSNNVALPGWEWFSRPFVMPPGYFIGLITNSITVADATYILNALVTELDA